MARWRSSYAAVCKTAQTGATPVRASIYNLFITCADDGIGRHERLKISWPQGRAGSSPALRTILGTRFLTEFLLYYKQ
jgi:hypothetical protein